MSKIVVGLHFGDEAKGLTTSWLCSQVDTPLVVRFNGGHQAGHTVVHNGKRHVFSSFGSGTLQGFPTYWSKYCTFSPAAFLRERELLTTPYIFVNPDCPVTTPFDIEANRNDKSFHGTVGVGFGTTLAREEAFYKLHVRDLFYPNILIEKLSLIASYYGCQWAYAEEITLPPFIAACAEAVKHIIVQDDTILKNYNCIYEGAQGILLDQDHGFFPHVTRSNTTSKNAIGLSDEWSNEIFYVMRSYLTRHGNGPFPAGEGNLALRNNEDETNVDGGFQGKFRVGMLNPQLTNYAIDCDSTYSRGVKKNLIISCMDQYELDVPRYLSSLKTWFPNVYLSHSPSADCIEKYAPKSIYAMY